MIRILFSKLFGQVRRRFLDQDFDAEVEIHLEMLVEENVRRGMGSEEARQAALRGLGNLTRVKEHQREERGLPQFETLFTDLRYGARMLRANPGFTLIAVLTLTLGIGVTTTVFTAYNAIALKALPVSDPNLVVRLERWFQHNRGSVQYEFSYPEYKYCRDRNDVFASMVAASGALPVVADGVEKVQGTLVSSSYFFDLGVPAIIGRTFLPDEDRTPGGNPVMVISHSFWERRFHGDQAIVGHIMSLNGVPFTVVGVAAKEFSGTAVIPQIPDFWAPVSMQQQLAPGRDWLNTPGEMQFQILARLKPGVTRSRAGAETAVLIRQLVGSYQEADRTITVTLQRTALIGNTEDMRFQASAVAIMLIVGMVLLVGCVNIANMLLARGAARQKEISVRLALGASRGRVIRQLMTESLLLSMIGGLGGFLFSVWTAKLLWIGIEKFVRERAGAEIAIGINLSPDAHVLAYAMFLSLAAGLLFGVSPALQFSRPDLTAALKDEGGFGARFSRSRLRSLLVGMQVTVSMVLLISAGLLMRGLNRAQTAEPGFETRSIYLLNGDLRGDTMRQLMDRLQTLPEVKRVAVGTMPLLGTWTAPILIDAERSRTLASYASDTYFDLLDIPLVRGRHFTSLEAQQGGNNLAIVSESTARKFWPAENPLGKHFKLDMNFQGSLAEFEIIGVVKDIRYASLSRVDVAHVYLAPRPGGWNTGLLVRTQGDPRRAIAAVRSAAAAVDSSLKAGLSTLNLEEGPVRLQRSFAQVSAMFAAILAALALALAAVGIYGVMSFVVSQQVKEIGIRMALGAKGREVLFAVVAQGLRPVICGVLFGIGGAAALSAYLHSILALPGASDLLYGVPFYDPVSFVGLSMFLVIIAGAASMIPARRALSVDPMIALRYE